MKAAYPPETNPTRWRAWHVGAAFFAGAALSLVIARSLDLLGSTYHPIEEAKMCYAALTDPDQKLHPQTREYLKGRLYWNAATWIDDSSWFEDWHLDFGPVDTSSLEGLRFAKDATGAEELYRAALTRHPRSATSIYTW